MQNLRNAKNSLLILFAGFFISCSCGDGGTPSAENPTVTLQGESGAQLAAVEVEIADSPSERQQGLMDRESLAENSGMLFVFSTDSDTAFWMKDTLIALDMIFIDADGVVVDVIENTTPLSETLLHSSYPFRYVLEVNAGFAGAHAIEPGARVQLPEGAGDSAS